ncbi:unnamed protein product [Clonostachys solani]|uniref:Uncharacterized protein n=1 Tax=Clonostachys solani TaxID=160281 RepID=A0A9N9ZHN0_9HYPO|nr:unnamed protein product [Clonostachys solani]
MAKKRPNRSQKAKADGQPENQPAAAPGAQAQEENPLQQRSENITIESGRPPRRKGKGQHQPKTSGPNPDIVPPRNQGSSRTNPDGIPKIRIKETSKTVPRQITKILPKETGQISPVKVETRLGSQRLLRCRRHPTINHHRHTKRIKRILNLLVP